MDEKQSILSDNEIAMMSSEERRALILRLSAHHVQFPWSAKRLRRARRARLSLMTIGSIILIPWIVYLALSLPKQYEASHWRIAWVGFDVLLLAFMSLTAWFGWKQRQLVLLTSFTTGVLLICDAWFDIGTAASQDMKFSIASAIFIELPTAFLLIAGAWRALAFIARATGQIETHENLWHASIRLPISPDDESASRHPGV